jgi:PPOX class probable FMN-dependent enzyme
MPDMRLIADIPALEALFDAPVPTSVTKVARRLTPLYRRWIGAARFCVLSTVGAEGTDGSPRGDDGPVVRIADDRTIWLPDWRGNNRIDSLRNIVRDGRVSLMFMVAGSNNVVRVNGQAVLTDDPVVTRAFERAGRHPKLVIVVTVGEVYFQCAKAILRARLWEAEATTDLPTAGELLQEADAAFDAVGYDLTYPESAKDRMW